MKYPILLLLALMAIFSSCSRTFFYQPADQQPERTEITYTHGVPDLRAKATDGDVAATLTTRGGSSFLNLNLAVFNLGDTFFTFEPELVKAYGYNKSGKRQELRVFTAREFIKRRNTKNALIIGAIAVVAISAAVASNSSGRKSEYDNDFDDFFFQPWFIINPQFNSAPYTPKDGLLRSHTLYEDEALQGVVKIKKNIDYNEKILVEVPINGEFVKFVFKDKVKKF
jgi:hypothetical protein